MTERTSNQGSSSDIKRSKYRFIRWTRKGTLIAAILFALLIPIVRFASYEMDHGISNVFTALLTVATLFLAGVWFVLSPRLSWLASLACVTIPIAIVFGLMNRYEFLGFSGDMMPHFRVRGTATRPPSSTTEGNHALSSSPRQSTGDRSVTSTQFLGNQRSGAIDDVQISKDWSKRPPEVQWKKPVGAGWAGIAISNGFVITLEQRKAEEWVTCYDLGNGELIWKHADPSRHYEVLGGLGPRSTPTIQGELVYTLGANGILNCLKLDSGDRVWTVDLLTIAGSTADQFQESVKWGRAASPLVYGDRLIVPLGSLEKSNRSLASFDRHTGKLQWRNGDDQISYVSPMHVKVLNEDYFLTVNENTVTLHSIDEGKQVWSHPWIGQSNGAATCSQPIMVQENRMFLSKGYGNGSLFLEFAKEDGKPLQAREIWKNSGLLRTKFSNPLLFQGHIYGISDGVLECVRLEDGKRTWKGGRYGHGQALLVGGQLLITSEEGELVLVSASPSKLQELGRLPVLEGITWNIPAVAGEWLLMRNGSEMACVKLPLE